MRLPCKTLLAAGAFAAVLCTPARAPLFAAGSDQSATVYTWVDAKGVRHFSDQPGSAEAQPVTLDAPSLMPAPAAPASTTPKATAKKGAVARGRTQAPASATQLSARCAQLRMQVESLEPARRAQIKQNGKASYLSGDDLVHFKDELRKAMQTACAAAAPSS
ncbi:MAG: DUF4124 domain-containing protein [Gammaproteobacteria bacterium]